MKQSLKRALFAVALVFGLFLMVGCGNQQASSKQATTVKDGTYVGTSKGEGGTLKVAVTIKGKKITDVKTVETHETAGLGIEASEQLREAIVAHNSVNVDAVSGASKSSEGYLTAVKNAVKKSGAPLSLFMSKKKIALSKGLAKTDYTYDVVVIGGGGGGLAAAVTAAENGATVGLLEKQPNVGGNTAVSGGEFNVPGSDIQKRKGIKDSKALFISDTLKGGDNIADPALVTTLANNANSAYEWLKTDVNVRFHKDELLQFGGVSVPRAVVPVGGTGAEIVNKLQKKAKKLGVKIYTSTKATALTTASGKVTGVTATNTGKPVTFHATKGVVDAAGGFAANVAMRVKYNPKYDATYKTTAVAGATGDGIVMAQKIGAQLVDMKQIQTYPTSNPETGIISYVADARFSGAILVNQAGKRFVNESGRRDDISNAIMAQKGHYAYLVWGQEIEKLSKTTTTYKKEFNGLKSSNLLAETNNVKSLADAFDIDATTLSNTVKTFNGYVKAKKDPDFQKSAAFTSIAKGPYYIEKVAPSTHHTMGGIKINTNAQAIDTKGQVIPGLYAAGEVTGGIHGTNRLGGNAICDIIVFGRIAGAQVTKD
ncbi:flavocytochrome c [Lacticaseibacillus absianus]|uniref:flavocytochrome c n=1 Tax=Lacticaseibacillus absianus TaxID=2729623 RepID=UPI0015CC5F2C|nr:flavocytochrome c [Lacticaseibacillus absianus]